MSPFRILCSLLVGLSLSAAFVVSPRTSARSSATVAYLTVPPAVVTEVQSLRTLDPASSSILQTGVRNYLLAEQQPPSLLLSLEERRPPTAEEIAAKKRNFNFWFWGGGFVAPFLATFYYFGLKFWEK